ncbi:unnamed protein product, partial [marine sediment metagenome]
SFLIYKKQLFIQFQLIYFRILQKSEEDER